MRVYLHSQENLSKRRACQNCPSGGKGKARDDGSRGNSGSGPAADSRGSTARADAEPGVRVPAERALGGARLHHLAVV